MGTGFYFWEYPDGDEKYGIRLARAWYRNAKYRGFYNEKPDQRCAVILAGIYVDEDHIIDFKLPAVEAAFVRFCARYERDLRTGETDKMKLRDMYVSKIESKVGTEVKVVCGTTRLPKGAANAKDPIGFAESNAIIVVKDKECISILECRVG